MFKNVSFTLKSLLFCFISIALLLLSFPPLRISVLIFFAFVPILALSRHSWSPRKSFFAWWGVGFLFFLFHLHWILNLHVEPWVKKFLWLGFILLAIYEGLFFGIQGYFASKLSKYRLPFFFPLVWFFIEWLRGIGAVGFPWSPIYLPVVDVPLIKETVSAFGGLGAGLFIITTNVFLSDLNLKGVIKTISLVAFLIVLGFLTKVASPLHVNDNLRVALIQPNILEEEDLESEWQKTYSTYLSLAKQLKNLPPVDLLVLSESAIPGFYRYTSRQRKFIKTLLDSTGAKFLLFGTADTKVYSRQIRPVNSAFLVRDSVVIGKYNKVHLVPFGEWIPYENRFKFLQKLNFGEGDYIPGDSVFPLSTNKLKLGVLICFESMFPELARELVNKNAQLLVNITNDGWFGKSLGPVEHFEFMRLRALETRRYVLRVGKTGISAIIDYDGNVLKKLASGKAGVIVGSVPLLSQKSLFVKYGYYTALMLGIMILGFITWIERRQR